MNATVQRPRPVLLVASAGIATMALVGWGLSPGGRTVLRESFTQQPTVYTELFFTDPPEVLGNQVTVPVTIVDHGIPQINYQLRSLLRNSLGQVTAQSTVGVAAQVGRAARTVLRLPAGSDPAQVEVDLTGHPQILRYRVGGPPPAAGGAP